MTNFENFDRKSYRKEKIDSKKRNRKSFVDNYDEHRFAKLNKKQIKQKKQEIEQEEKWEDWENEIP